MIFASRIALLALILSIPFGRSVAQIVPDIPDIPIPDIPSAPSPPPSPSESPSPLVSPTSSPLPSPSSSPRPSLPASVTPSSPPAEDADEVPIPEAVDETPVPLGDANVVPSTETEAGGESGGDPGSDEIAIASPGNPRPESAILGVGQQPEASLSPTDTEDSLAAAEVSETPSPVQPVASASAPALPSVTPSSSAVPATATEDVKPSANACVRDASQPRPALGISPSRYAFSVFASAAAIAFANMFYKVAATWETHQNHMLVRIICILVGRLSIIFSVKLSSALVAVTAKYPGIDSGADVGGAYLTWASAILSSLYHESVMMTLTATSYVVQVQTWYPNLQEFLSPQYSLLRDADVGAVELQNQGLEESYDSSSDVEFPANEGFEISLFERVKSGRTDKHLLILTAFLYVVMEVITLIISLLELLKELSGSATEESVFVDIGGSSQLVQCPVRISDLGACFATVAVQGAHLLTRQQSLVPLLALTSEIQFNRWKSPRRLIRVLKWSTVGILIIWVVSLLCLPLLQGGMAHLFIVGDVSLFWYVMIAPPSYESPSFIVTAIISVSTAAIGAFLIFRVGRASLRTQERT